MIFIQGIMTNMEPMVTGALMNETTCLGSFIFKHREKQRKNQEGQTHRFAPTIAPEAGAVTVIKEQFVSHCPEPFLRACTSCSFSIEKNNSTYSSGAGADSRSPRPIFEMWDEKGAVR